VYTAQLLCFMFIDQFITLDKFMGIVYVIQEPILVRRVQISKQIFKIPRYLCL